MQTMMINFIVKFVLVGDSSWFTVGVDRTAGQLVFELVTSGQQSKRNKLMALFWSKVHRGGNFTS